MSAKRVEVVRLNGSRAGCPDSFSSRRPVGGEVFYLDSPFIEPTTRPGESIFLNNAASGRTHFADCLWEGLFSPVIDKCSTTGY